MNGSNPQVRDNSPYEANLYIWRGEVTRTLSDHDQLLAIQGKRLNEIHEYTIAQRTRLSLFAAVGAVVGSGVGGAIIIALLHA